MSRVERFRERRRFKRRFNLSIMLFVLILVTGSCIADYSVNSLMKSEEYVSLLSLRNKGSYYEISFLNKKFYFNMEYIERDLKRIREMLKTWG